MMDLNGLAQRLLAPWCLGDEVCAGATLQGWEVELGLRIYLRTSLGTLEVELQRFDTNKPWAAHTPLVGLAYRQEGAGGKDGKFAQQVCQALARRVERNEQACLQVETAAPPSRVRTVEVEQLLVAKTTESGIFYTLSPYVGCTIGCQFCYAQSRLDPLRELVGLPQLRWGSYVDVRTNAAQVLEQELSEKAPAPIKFCPIVSDPYQPLEGTHRITRACLEVLRSARDFTTLLLTRSALILDDIELIASLPRPIAGVSLPTLDEATLRHFEGRAASAEQRVEILRRLKGAGVETFAVVQPMLPGPAEQLADQLCQYADSVHLGPLEGEFGAADLFADTRFCHARSPQWQTQAHAELKARLLANGTPVWSGELPPSLVPDIVPGQKGTGP